jgi:hypothetical protein
MRYHSSSAWWHHRPPIAVWCFIVFGWVIRCDLTAYLNYNNRFISIGKWCFGWASYCRLIEYLMKPLDSEWMKISKRCGSIRSLRSICWIAAFCGLCSCASNILSISSSCRNGLGIGLDSRARWSCGLGCCGVAREGLAEVGLFIRLVLLLDPIWSFWTSCC